HSFMLLGCWSSLGSIDLVLKLQRPLPSVVIRSIASGDELESAGVVRNFADAIEQIAHVRSYLGAVVEEAVAGRRVGGVPGRVQSPVDDTIRVSHGRLRAIRKRLAVAIARVANPADVRFVERGVPLALLPVERSGTPAAWVLPVEINEWFAGQHSLK